MEPTEVIAITFANGTIGRMQFFAEPTDKATQEDIDKTQWVDGTDTGVGQLTVAIATDFSSVNYTCVTSAVNVQAGNSGASTGVESRAVGSVTVRNQLATFALPDPEAWDVAMMGDQ